MTGALRPVAAAVAKGRSAKQERRIFVLDTNVLMHDPTAIFRFEEHDIYIPMTVLEELDAGKKGLSESARNVRQVSRFLDELMRNATKKQIDRGLVLPTAVPINHGFVEGLYGFRNYSGSAKDLSGQTNLQKF